MGNLCCSGSKAFVMAVLHLGYQMHGENKVRVSEPALTCSPVGKTWRCLSLLRLLLSQGQREGTTNTLEIPTCQKITFEIEMF